MNLRCGGVLAGGGGGTASDQSSERNNKYLTYPISVELVLRMTPPVAPILILGGGGGGVVGLACFDYCGENLAARTPGAAA
jgi:hypothetical protein